MSTAKEELVRLVQAQPADSSREEIVRQLAFHVMVERGLADSDAKRVISNTEMVAAMETVQGIYDRAQVLEGFPEIGQRYLESTRNVRMLLYGHYRIAYLIQADDSIDILGVFHGALEISSYGL
jgi:plasmid stabilization system protein ParE